MLLLNFAKIVGFVKVVTYIDLSKLIHGVLSVVRCRDFSQLLHGFVKIYTWMEVATWICESRYMDLLKLLHGFLLVPTLIC